MVIASRRPSIWCAIAFLGCGLRTTIADPVLDGSTLLDFREALIAAGALAELCLVS